MKLWKKLVLLNLTGLVGVVSSVFVIPGDTPFYTWLIVAAAVIAALNVAFVISHRRSKETSAPTTSKVTTVVVIVGAGIWILDLLIHILRR